MQSRLFTIHGMFLSKCRSDKAQRLLRTTALDIKTIAALCGFDDPTYFARWFRKKSGVSATGYREKLDENSKSAAAKGGKDVPDAGDRTEIFGNKQKNA